MYTHRVRAAATGAGVSCLIHSGAQHLCFVFSRLVLLNLSETTRDSSVACANFRRCNRRLLVVGWIVCDPRGSYAIHVRRI
jgi:hypothetical protein